MLKDQESENAIRKVFRRVGNLLMGVWKPKEKNGGGEHQQSIHIHELPFYAPHHESVGVLPHPTNYMYEQSEESGKTGYLRVIGGCGEEKKFEKCSKKHNN